MEEQSNYLKNLAKTVKVKPMVYPMTTLLEINKDKFIISQNGIDMKVTIDAMAWLVNANNLVKVGN
jgi:hypothetical protein